MLRLEIETLGFCSRRDRDLPRLSRDRDVPKQHLDAKTEQSSMLCFFICQKANILQLSAAVDFVYEENI